MYPKVIYNLEKLKSNLDAVVKLTADAGCSTMIVTKSFCADQKICEMIAAHPGVDFIADSRISNIKRYIDFAEGGNSGMAATGKGSGSLEASTTFHPVQGQKKETVLLRLPMMCEIRELVRYVDISQNSEMATIKAISEEAVRKGKTHGILLMVDLGDLREGMFYRNEDEIIETARRVEELNGVELRGISTNLTCYGAIIPKDENLSILCGLADRIEATIDRKLEIVSGGNSSSIYLTWQGGLPRKINNLRLGESFVLGNDTAYGQTVPGTVRDAVTIEAQIIEIKTKPSKPIGEIGKDAFGNTPFYEDKGEMRRAILGIGQQDTDVDGMIPLDRQIDVLGGSSDHMLVDLTGCDRKYEVGDVLSFRLQYGALLRASTSPYIDKVYV